jgi:hypothetical protein
MRIPSRSGINIEDRFYTEDEYRRCAVKFRHTNVLHAFAHAKSIINSNPLARPGVYACPYCDGLHLTSGKMHKRPVLLQKSLTHLEHVMAHPNFFAKAPLHIQMRNTKMAEDIKIRLKELNHDKV